VCQGESKTVFVTDDIAKIVRKRIASDMQNPYYQARFDKVPLDKGKPREFRAEAMKSKGIKKSNHAMKVAKLKSHGTQAITAERAS
jgi:hypothetical protein